jgi:hypothetical protein
VSVHFFGCRTGFHREGMMPFVMGLGSRVGYVSPQTAAADPAAIRKEYPCSRN